MSDLSLALFTFDVYFRASSDESQLIFSILLLLSCWYPTEKALLNFGGKFKSAYLKVWTIFQSTFSISHGYKKKLQITTKWGPTKLKYEIQVTCVYEFYQYYLCICGLLHACMAWSIHRMFLTKHVWAQSFTSLKEDLHQD